MKNQIIVITGAGRGIGKALALGFAKQGASLSLASRNAAEIQAVARLCAEVGAPAVLGRACDIGDAQAVELWIKQTVTELGRIDALINNASLLGPRLPISDYPHKEWMEVMHVNANGMFFVTQAVLKEAMLKQGSGAIINISSGVGRVGKPLWGAYSVSKFGCEGFTQVLASELKEKNIRVFSLDPEKTRTGMRAEAYPAEDPATLKTPDTLVQAIGYMIERVPMEATGRAFSYTELAKAGYG